MFINFYLFRRLSVLVLAILFISASLPIVANAQQIPTTASIQKKFAELEATSDGRLGVSAINTANNARIQYRAEERFPLCSTSKVMVVAAILKQSEENESLLQKRITYRKKEVEKSGYTPITQQHLSNGMSVNELCQAAIEYSDNMAMNLLMKTLGGPVAVTTYARSIDDHTFQLDQWEPELNTAPNNNRDTTTPNAMAKSLKQLTLGDVLAPSQQEQLKTWLKNNTTGNARIRAGVPKGWIVGDKTGTGDYGTSNDIAIIWPPNCSPIILAIYFTQNKKGATLRENVIASTTHLVLDEFAKTDQCIKTNITNGHG
jgi:beta-lactamase class A